MSNYNKTLLFNRSSFEALLSMDDYPKIIVISINYSKPQHLVDINLRPNPATTAMYYKF